MNIGETIKQERIKKGLTQEELGDRIGVSSIQVHRIEQSSLEDKNWNRAITALGMEIKIERTKKQLDK